MSCPFQATTGNISEVENAHVNTCQTAEEKLNYFWNKLNNESKAQTVPRNENLRWPNIQNILNEIRNKDYNEIFTKYQEVTECDKILCRNGAVACVRIEWLKNKHEYTGLFQQSDFGFIRLSSALMPLNITDYMPSIFGWNSSSDSNLFPCAALKFYRNDVNAKTKHDYNDPVEREMEPSSKRCENTHVHTHSGNLLFGGKKTGQSELDFFAHGMATHLTEKISVFLRWILNIFYNYSKYPLQLGLSEFASITQDGEIVEYPKFPWCMSLQPVLHFQQQNADKDAFLQQICNIPSNTHIYDVYGLHQPQDISNKNAPIQLLGRVITASPFIYSNGDMQIYFKHQRKEEDYELHPEWLDNIQEHSGVGSSYFEKHVNNKNYI